MPHLSTLTFSGLQQWLWPAIGFILLCIGILFWSYRGSTGGRVRWACFALKVLGLAALALCLLEPLWFGQRAKPGANLFAVVGDNSQGMEIKDEGESTTRGAQLQELLDPAKANWLAALGDTFELRRYLFDARMQATNDFHELVFDGRSSGIGTALRTINERFRGRSLAGVVLLTDGNATDLREPLPDMTGMPPVYPVVMGKVGAVRDISLQQVAVTQSAFEDAPVTVQADVAAAGFRGRPLTLKLLDRAGKVVQEKTLPARGDGEVVPFHFELKPETGGLVFYQAKVALQDASAAPGAEPDEATTANNARVFVVDRDQGPYRVLYVSGRLNWEFKFLNRAVSEDKEVDLVGLIRVAKREPKFTYLSRANEDSNPLFRGAGLDASEVQQFDQPVIMRLNTRDAFELKDNFPRLPEELYDYHAVILDDLEAEFFTADQQQLLEKFVSERGGGLLMLGGMESFEEGHYQNTPIGNMLPVYLGRPQERPALQSGYQLDLTREGILQPWARVRTRQEEEQAERDKAPPFAVINHVRGIKPAASVIALVKAPQGFEAPALITQRFGRGRTGAFLVGNFWRWGMMDPEATLNRDKAWRQMTRWLVSDVPTRVEITAEPRAEEASNAVVLQVRVRDTRYKPLDDANVMIEIEPVVFEGSAGAMAEPVRLRAEPALTEPGLYEATYVSRLTGGYRATAIVTNTVGAEEGRAEAGWAVDLAAEEFKSLIPNVALLESIARKTGGEVIPASQLGDFVKRLPSIKAPVMESWSYPLWHTPWMFAFALACLLAEWGLRRWKGMP